MHALQPASLDRQVARLGCAAAEHDSVEILHQLARRDVLAHLGVGHKGNPLGRHQVDAALHDAFVQLHVGDAVHQQAADAVGALEDGHAVPGPVELRRAGQPGRPRADYGHGLARPVIRRLRHDPALGKAAVDDRVLDVLDGHRRVVDAQRARALARRGANPPGELREIIGLEQPVQRLLPQPAVDQVVPFRDQVVDRAAGGHPVDDLACVAERDAAVHTARALDLQPLVGEFKVEFHPVANSLQRLSLERQLAVVFHETGWFAHVLSPASVSGEGWRVGGWSQSQKGLYQLPSVSSHSSDCSLPLFLTLLTSVPTNPRLIILIQLKRSHDHLVAAQTGGFHFGEGLQHALVVLRHDLDEL